MALGREHRVGAFYEGRRHDAVTFGRRLVVEAGVRAVTNEFTCAIQASWVAVGPARVVRLTATATA